MLQVSVVECLRETTVRNSFVNQPRRVSVPKPSGGDLERVAARSLNSQLRDGIRNHWGELARVHRKLEFPVIAVHQMRVCVSAPEKPFWRACRHWSCRSILHDQLLDQLGELGRNLLALELSAVPGAPLLDPGTISS